MTAGTTHTQDIQCSAPIPKKIVLLVHGIRTRALWQKRIEPQLRDENTVVEAVGYHYFNVFEFLSPLWTRKKAIEKVQWRIEKAIDDHPDHELILIAQGLIYFIRFSAHLFTIGLDCLAPRTRPKFNRLANSMKIGIKR